ncbi:hypothetical protein K491DRAFT_723271 [Lophiostoma macrostomum CBS 122681]|uniref:Uncharacterized protein n=1 Tax=Lophiostoma macrostomum CBS 122681 TaxID=1314788 RepID=A0A6A6SN62_9PLEO|nr:hypothetical protein K491DRAFT_723271 [Lophiostoma macrostomum CBS 122681]
MQEHGKPRGDADRQNPPDSTKLAVWEIIVLRTILYSLLFTLLLWLAFKAHGGIVKLLAVNKPASVRCKLMSDPLPSPTSTASASPVRKTWQELAYEYGRL